MLMEKFSQMERYEQKYSRSFDPGRFNSYLSMLIFLFLTAAKKAPIELVRILGIL